jgi:hypothetical protein
VLDDDAAIELLAGDLAIPAGHGKVMRSRQQQYIVTEEHVITDVDESADRVDEHVGQARRLTDPDPRNRTADHGPGVQAGGFPVTETAQPPSRRAAVAREGLPDELNAAPDGSAPLR